MFVLLIILLIIVLYVFATKNHNYWAKKRVKHDPPIPLFGNHLRNYLAIRSLTEISVEYYNKFPGERIVGYYRGREPELIIRDPDIVRNILNVDFAYFYPRGLGRNIELEPILFNLFHADGDRWKILRQQLTPAFTTAKLKKMFPLVVQCANKLQIMCEEIVSRGGEYDVRELMARFTTEFIGACGFGIEMDTINDEKCLFRALGKTFFDKPLKTVVLLVLWELFPELRNHFRCFDVKIDILIMEMVETIRKQRNFKPSGRNDFIDLLLDLESKGKIKGESIEKRNPDGTPIEIEMQMDVKIMAAQVFIFFGAGFETSSSATSFTLHQLAFNPVVQRKVQEEIDRVLAKYDNKLCYDAIAEMMYLDMAFKESMRIFPSLGTLHRVCNRKYQIPGTDVTIDPGTKILIPIQAIQNDEQYFDNPNEYRPERFTAEEVEKRHKYVYLPFGEGPRACIGGRLGQMQSLAGLAAILHKFTVEPCEKTRRVLEINRTSNVVQGIKHGIPLKIKLRTKDL